MTGCVLVSGDETVMTEGVDRDRVMEPLIELLGCRAPARLEPAAGHFAAAAAGIEKAIQ